MPEGSDAGHTYADFGELQSMLGEWRAERDQILADGKELARALGLVQAPATDVMSEMQAGATKNSLTELQRRNDELLERLDEYIEKLESSLHAMRHGEQDAASEIDQSYRT
ncbi:MAG: hypothetical protein GEU98_19155 [Pseudonocardiaceae bacterium]|nr:hypothetical protein [Pseudonocardiaceae bacterium]